MLKVRRADAGMFSARGWWATLALAVMMTLTASAGVAQAFPTLNVSTTFPAGVTVGQTESASFTLSNGSTAEDPSFVLCKVGDTGACAGQPGIILIPSCGQDAGTACPPAGADPGVFAIDPAATGGLGTACAGVAFTATPLGDFFGKVHFAPTGGADIALSMGQTCRVDFKFTVSKLPTLDARPATGTQTAPIVTASARSLLGQFITGGGSTVTSVFPAPPATPAITGVAPSSPSNDNTPEVRGSAPAGTTVQIYTDTACSGTALASGSAAAFASPGLTASVPDNSTTTFYAIATSPSTGLSSGCSVGSSSYTEDSAVPQTTIFSGPSAASTVTQPVFTFNSDDGGASFACRVDGAPFAACVSPYQTAPLAVGSHTFEVRAADSAGNTDATPASQAFTINAVTIGSSQPPGCSLRGNTITGTPGSDTLSGTPGTDIILGLAGGDTLSGLGGADCLFGEGGADRLLGGAGGDRLFGGADNDTLSGEAGNDRVSGEDGVDRLDGGAGNDHLVGAAGGDRITDRRGTDAVSGGAANDRIDVRDTSARDRRGRDRVNCGPGVDTVLADPRDIVQRDCERITKRSL